MITEILSCLQIFSMRKATSLLFKIFKNLQKIDKKTIFLAYVGPLKANYRLLLLLLTVLITFFICMLSYIHICFYCFLIFCFYFHLLFLTLVTRKHILQFTMFHTVSLQTSRNITEIKNTS